MGDNSSNSQTRLIIKRSGGAGFSLITNTSSTAGTQYTMPSDIRGLSIANKLGITSSYFLNTSKLIGTDVVQASIVAVNDITLGGVIGGGGTQYTDKRCTFSSIGDGLTDQECILMAKIINFAQGILGRQ